MTVSPILFREVRDKNRVQEAVHLTDDVDWQEVADWCDGEIRDMCHPGGVPYRVLYLGADRSEGAVVGDWIVSHSDGFHVWVDEAFPRYYEPADGAKR